MSALRTILAGALAAAGLSACTTGFWNAPGQADAVAPVAAEAAPETALNDKPGPGGRMPTGRDMGVRSAVVAPHAAAATAHPLATEVALDVMKKGGSAM